MRTCQLGNMQVIDSMSGAFSSVARDREAIWMFLLLELLRVEKLHVNIRFFFVKIALFFEKLIQALNIRSAVLGVYRNSGHIQEIAIVDVWTAKKAEYKKTATLY